MPSPRFPLQSSLGCLGRWQGVVEEKAESGSPLSNLRPRGCATRCREEALSKELSREPRRHVLLSLEVVRGWRRWVVECASVDEGSLP